MNDEPDQAARSPWIEAAKILGLDPTARVVCPAKRDDILEVHDEVFSTDRTMMERYLTCPTCGARNIMRMRVQKAPRVLFTAEALEDPAHQTPGRKPTSVRHIEVGGDSAREVLYVTRAPKLDYTDPIAFYRSALIAPPPDRTPNDCRPLSEEAAITRVGACTARSREREPFELDLGGPFVAAMLMDEDDDLLILMFETTTEYLLVEWEVVAQGRSVG